MSAIAALLQLEGGPVPCGLIEAMLVAQRASGPDGDTHWVDGQVALGQARFDATAGDGRSRGVASLDGRLYVAADARIDAQEELVARLRGRGHALDAGVTEEELILRAYDCWGEACLQSLLGDFSFVLWDARQRRLVCAVDALGAKPLFYAHRGAMFCAASNVDAVRMCPGVRHELDEIVVGDFLIQGCPDDRARSIYADIPRVPPGHFLIVDARGPHLHRYHAWPDPAELGLGNHPDPVPAFEELLDNAVRDRLRTPTAAVLLSGGLDSPLVARAAVRVMAPAGGAPRVEGFTSVFEYLIPDEEKHFAALVAESLGIAQDVQAYDGGHFFDWTARISPPQPLDATVMGPWLEQLKRLRQRHRTLFTGYDGDAMLACTPRLHFRRRVRKREFRQLAADVIAYVAREHGPPPVGLRTSWARSRAGPVPPLPSWVDPCFGARTQLAERWTASWEARRDEHPRAAALALVSGSGMGHLFDGGRSESLGAALEVVHPLADLRILRFALELPAVPWCVSKRLLREAGRDLPMVVRRRQKAPLASDPNYAWFARGERVPSEGWSSPELARFVDAAGLRAGLEGPRAPEDLTTRLRAVGLGYWLSRRIAA